MDNYAVLKIKNRQYIVTKGDTIVCHTISSKDDIQILALKDEGKLVVGDPLVKESSLKVEDLGTKRVKTETRRYKSKSRYRKNKSHTDTYSRVKVVSFSSKGSKIEFVKQEEVSTTPKKDVAKKESKSVSITTLGLSESVEKLLIEAGYKSVEDLKKAKKQELVDIKGLGEKKADQILSKLKK